MITRRLCISAAVLCCVLAVATTASAECAWVLWSSLLPPSGSEIHNLEDAYQTQPACLREARIRWDDAKQAGQPKPGWALVFRCLPDTVDPRGPKGSK